DLGIRKPQLLLDVLVDAQVGLVGDEAAEILQPVAVRAQRLEHDLGLAQHGVLEDLPPVHGRIMPPCVQILVCQPRVLARRRRLAGPPPHAPAGGAPRARGGAERSPRRGPRGAPPPAAPPPSPKRTATSRPRVVTSMPVEWTSAPTTRT